MAEAFPTFAPFSLGGSPAKAKCLVLGLASPVLVDWSRSLNLEHVSAAGLVRQEISRRPAASRRSSSSEARNQSASDELTLSLLRRWFWTRKPEAGFVLSEFPATLLQACVFDEWLEERRIALSAVVVPTEEAEGSAVVEHYRALGVDLVPADAFAA